MAAKTAAQEEFDTIISRSAAEPPASHHPADAADYAHDRDHQELDEEEEHAQRRLDENMRMPSGFTGGFGSSIGMKLPHRDFDSGRTTGVKGVIADARSYEEARRTTSGWRSKLPGSGNKRASFMHHSESNRGGSRDGSASEEEEAFIERWRQSRRDELAREGKDIRNRRTSPSVRRYGRFDEVDAMGYLDAIEKVGRDTTVVVFVYDPEVCSLTTPLFSTLLSPPLCSPALSLRNW